MHPRDRYPAGTHEAGHDALLLHETRHRFANELAATLASLHLAKARGADGELVDDAIERVDAQARLLRLLVEPRPAACDVVESLLELSHLLLRSRRSDRRTTIRVSAVRVVVPGEVAEVVLTIVNELLTNALKKVEAGRIGVRVRLRADALRVVVENECRDAEATSPVRGVGTTAVRMIAEQHGARLVFGIGKGRFRATLLWPVRPYEVEDDPEDLPF